jgi:secondary thiamine-phosphate synthase enzyme
MKRISPRDRRDRGAEDGMSKRSTVTVRERPLADAASVSGSLNVHAETLTIETAARVEVRDLTDEVMARVQRLGVQEGLANIVSLHTTASVFINEFQPALVADVKTLLNRIVDSHANWLHNDPAHSDCDRTNADAHLRSMLLGHSLTLQVSGGELVLGTWQRVLLVELDGPRTRSLRITAIGVG